MTRVFLVMVVSAMLVTLGFSQTPPAGSNTDPASVQGCLGGSDGAYTVVQDGTGQLFKISTSSVDLKAHLGHDVKLTGQKSSAAAGNSLAVTELSMISEHCAAAAAAPATTVTPSPETVIPPDAATAPPVAASAAAAAAPPVPADPAAATASAAPAATVAPTPSTPAVDTVAPATASPSVPSAPVVEVAPPSAPTAPPAATVSTPAAEAAHAARPSVHARKLAAAQTSAAKTEAAAEATVSPSSADTATPAAAASSAAEAASVPAAPAPDAAAPAPVTTHRAGSLTLLVSFVVLVIVLGTTAPLIGRWRKRKMLERDGSPNLSFTNDTNNVTKEESTTPASSDPDKPDSRKVA
jgi:hypothetical protein